MNHRVLSRTRTCCLITLALAGSVSAAWAYLPEPLQDKAEAARVARKVERAKSRAERQAKEEQEAVRHFAKEVSRYDRLHQNLKSRLGAETPATAQALADAIAKDRSKARQGDIFLSEIQPLLKRLIAEQLTGLDASAARKALNEGNLEKEGDPVVVVPKVNALYPAGAARSTVPSSLLLTLPSLPECLHYRFVGRDLVLIDSVAQIIVDVLPDATPAIGTK